MSSLVTEVLSSAGKLEKDDLNAKIVRISKRIEDIKLEVQETLQGRHKEFLPHFVETVELSSHLNEATTEADMLLTKIEKEIKPQLHNATCEYQELTKQLEESSVLVDIVAKLAEIHETLEAAKQAQKKKDYLSAATSLQHIESLISQTKHGCEKDVDILQAMKTEQLVRKEKLKYDLGEIWNQHIIWSVPKSKDDLPYKVELKLMTSGNKTLEEIRSLLQALYYMKELEKKVKKLGTNLMTHVLEIVVSCQVDLQIEKSNASVTLVVVVNKKEHAETAQVFENLHTVFKFLYGSFMKLQVKKESDEKSETLMSLLGKQISREFCDCLIQDCLSPAIPSHSKDLEGYSKVIELTSNLQVQLETLGFLEAGNTTILEYARNVDSLFANKMCQELLVCARKLMKEDLHVTITLPEKEALSEPLPKLARIKAMQEEDKLTSIEDRHDLSKNVFHFPKCQVSSSTKKVLDLLHEVLQEAIKSSPSCAVRLFCTARNICELYCDVVPVYHKESITTLPQQTGLFRDGRKDFLSLSLIVLISTCNLAFIPVSLLQVCHGQKPFIELIIGKLSFLSVFQNIADDISHLPAAERAVKQCIHHLQLLQRVWKDVLPESVFSRVMGTLLNSVLEEIIVHITALEDISEEAGIHLVSLFGIITDQAPGLFKIGDEDVSVMQVHKNVPRWRKFQELRLILGANMREIVDRWADGKGPVALDFTAEEIKQLIRALFQNTERRAAVLAKLR
ncbi:centromere/kinetochore protein zw10 homolog [Limulus polyphemus]|uniref:Centromere/kinetochore protein zw10 homolog n=1 Tax=Limulus polyphemus TaxID=6850 RepID=A0ABM1T936_LIMPO|nr:centromere/kinetochore protein zw10 homolog [Limulus polyphemus]